MSDGALISNQLFSNIKEPNKIVPLLIGTGKNIIYWDGQKATSVFKTKNRAYGITWNRDHVFVAIGRENKIFVFDKNFEEVDIISLSGSRSDLHQALWYGNKLYAVDANHASLIRYDGKENRLDWKQERFCEKDDKPHINSIWCDGQFFYIVEHWKYKLPKKIRIFNLQWQCVDVLEIEKSIFTDQVNGIHNVYKENDVLYTLGPEMFIQIDLHKTIAHRITGPWQCYLRGLARTDNRFYIGMSKFIAVRSARIKGESAFMVLDDNLNAMQITVLENTGEVYEIRALKGDKAHNGIDCPFQG